MADTDLPSSVTRVTQDGRTIWVVGTAHLSEHSVQDVRQTVSALRPETIAVELCQARYKALTDPQAWRRMDIFRILREKKAILLLTQLVLSAVYRRLGDQLNLQPGAEMIEAIHLAERTGARLVLIDRDIQVTFRRVWGYLGFWSRCKLLGHMIASCLQTEQLDQKTIEQLRSQDTLEAIMADFAARFPQVKQRLIDERDLYMAQMLRRTEGSNVVAVVGAGHVQGIVQNLDRDYPIEELERVPPRSFWSSLIAWLIPAALVGLLVYGFIHTGPKAWTNVYIWVLATGLLSAIGAAAAFAHPLAILTAFVVAPFTTLHPLLAAGWFAGLVQAWIRRPTVEDLEELPNSISTIRGFWSNPVTRILLVTALTNIGGSIGLALALGWIGARSM